MAMPKSTTTLPEGSPGPSPTAPAPTRSETLAEMYMRVENSDPDLPPALRTLVDEVMAKYRPKG